MSTVWVTPVPYTGEDEVEGATPEQANLREGVRYLAITFEGNCSPSYDGEAYIGVVNPDGELWYISNRHLRVVSVDGFDIPRTYSHHERRQ